ncbi:MAG: tRNA 2-thiouridine(34) synthase MnmA [Anaerorhabdus sp.]
MKILVGLSGGVDSAVAAYLLKKQGHEVTCAFMRNWDSLANQDFLGNPTIDNEICPQEQDWMDAKDTAEKLGLDIKRVDFVKEYWDDVFVHFIEEYKKGRTPNPDILCNQYIKFSSFYKYAMEQGFEYLATGHYAKVEHKNGDDFLLKADDLTKDQSYFLCKIPKNALKNTLFPLGNITKQEVRKIAEELDLSIAKKKDSTGICFIGERNFKDFLKNYIPAKKGIIIDINSKKELGKHDGVLYYTIGQRKGLDIGGEGGPWFVVGKDVEKNILIVASGENNNWLISTSCIVTNAKFLVDFNETIKCSAKFRYRQKDHDVTITKINDSSVKCEYLQGVKAVTPGQEAVFYDGNTVLGGGVIDKIFNGDEDIDLKIKEYLISQEEDYGKN